MKSILFSLFICSAAMASIPSQFYVTERFFSLVSTFDVATEVDLLASATKHFFSFTPTYDLQDLNGTPVATARARFFSWGTIADVVDGKGFKIGRIEENLWRIIPWAEYRLFDADEKVIAIATMNFFGTYFTLHHPTNPEKIFATITRPFIRCFRDAWTVQIIDNQIFEEGWIDPRLLVLLAVYQTDKENRAKFYAEFADQIQQEINNYEGNRQ